jgi:hypothetical protein
MDWAETDRITQQFQSHSAHDVKYRVIGRSFRFVFTLA